MSKEREALKLALNALEESLGYVEEEAENAQRLYGQYPTRQARIQGLKDDARKHMDAIISIREALAEQPAQQQCMEHGECFGGECIYPAQQPAQQQEPVAYVYEREIDGFGLRKDVKFLKPVEVGSDLYTSPPASKPLTDEEIDKLPWGSHEGNPMTFAEGLRDFARAIETKLKEKNT